MKNVLLVLICYFAGQGATSTSSEWAHSLGVRDPRLIDIRPFYLNRRSTAFELNNGLQTSPRTTLVRRAKRGSKESSKGKAIASSSKGKGRMTTPTPPPPPKAIGRVFGSGPATMRKQEGEATGQETRLRTGAMGALDAEHGDFVRIGGTAGREQPLPSKGEPSSSTKEKSKQTSSGDEAKSSVSDKSKQAAAGAGPSSGEVNSRKQSPPRDESKSIVKYDPKQAASGAASSRSAKEQAEAIASATESKGVVKSDNKSKPVTTSRRKKSELHAEGIGDIVGLDVDLTKGGSATITDVGRIGSAYKGAAFAGIQAPSGQKTMYTCGACLETQKPAHVKVKLTEPASFNMAVKMAPPGVDKKQWLGQR